MSRADRPLRVVLVSRIFAPEPAAASFRLQALTTALARAGHEVEVITSRPRPTPVEPVEAPGVRVRRWPVLRNRDGHVRGYLPYLSFDVPAALRLLVARRPDVVVVEPPPTTGAVVRAVCTLRRVPYVYYAGDVVSDAARGAGVAGPVVRALAVLEGWAMRGARGVVAVSPSVAERVRALVGPVRQGRNLPGIAVVGHGIDTEVFAPAEPGEQPPDGAPRTYLVYAGSTSSWHGADVFVRALPQVLERVPDARLVFVGDGAQTDELRTLADQLAPGRVEFRPTLPPAQAARWIRFARGSVVSLKPGQNYDLAFPTKLFAAVACGTPVVFAGVGPAVDVVRDNALGEAVDYGAGAAAAMVRVLTDPATADPAGRRAEADRLSGWAREHVSIRRTGEQAAALVASATAHTS